MRKVLIVTTAFAALTIAPAAYAQSNSTLVGAGVGAGAGAVVAGPVGAVVGGVAGGVIGANKSYRRVTGNRVCWRDVNNVRRCRYR